MKNIYNDGINETSLRGLHGDQAISQALVRIGNILDRYADYVQTLNRRIEHLETDAKANADTAAGAKVSVNKNNDNENLRCALIDADNALQKAINHFRKTSENNN